MSIQDIATLIQLATPVMVFLFGLTWALVYKNLSKDTKTAVDKVARLVVPAVEQTVTGLSSQQKKEEAILMVEEVLRSLGFKNVSPVLIDAAIEASVFAMNRALNR